MKKLFAAFLFVLALLVSAPVVKAQAPVFKCYASSYHGYGYGWAPSEAAAMVIALRECAVNTPAYDTCFVRWCARER